MAEVTEFIIMLRWMRRKMIVVMVVSLVVKMLTYDTKID